jgi:glutamyl-tRNA synthetase
MVVNEKFIRAYALKNAIEHDGKSVVGAVLAGLFNHGLKKDKIKQEMPEIQKVLKEINKLSVEEQKVLFKKYEKLIGHRHEREGLPELPGAKKGKVVMRFRPAPSGPLHVGHIISNMISSLFVKEHGGKFYVVIDDTNPESTLKEAYVNHKKDCDWIFGNVTKYVNSSDNMEKYYEYAERLLKKDKAYVCTCEKEDFKKLIDAKKACECRKLSIDKQLERWNKMLDKKGFGEGAAVLRFKSSIDDKNPAMRDFPLARINLTKHPKQGTKYRVWPLMNLAVSVDDIELGMTHVIRGKDHRDNAKRQEMIFKVFNKKSPWTFFIGRIKFTDLVLSKRKIEALIKKGKYSGWDDPRLPTLASLRKRKFKPESFAAFAEQRGLTEVDKVMSEKDFFKALSDSNK